MSAELQQSRNSCSGRRAKLHEGCFGRGPCFAPEKACMPGYIIRAFAAIVINLPRPLKGLPAGDDLEAKRREMQSLGHNVWKLHSGPLLPFIGVLLVCQSSQRLSVCLSLHLIHIVPLRDTQTLSSGLQGS